MSCSPSFTFVIAHHRCITDTQGGTDQVVPEDYGCSGLKARTNFNAGVSLTSYALLPRLDGGYTGGLVTIISGLYIRSLRVIQRRITPSEASGAGTEVISLR